MVKRTVAENTSDELNNNQGATLIAPPTKTAKTSTGNSEEQVLPTSNSNANGESNSAAAAPATSRRFNISESESATPGTVYCFGMNDCGQLGFKCKKRNFPALVPDLEEKKIKDIVCGGMHTIVLDTEGLVWSFGLNDDKALGRPTPKEEDSFKPGRVVGIPEKIKQISAGDSHSAALSEDGDVYAWGCFKDDNGNFGLISDDDGEICRESPEKISASLGLKFVKIASGAHHIAMLGEDDQLYTCGAGKQGQLGRQSPTTQGVFTREFLLKPAAVRVGPDDIKLRDVWTGEFSTYCSSSQNEIFVFGLNNFAQLGIRPKDVEDDEDDDSATDTDMDIISIPTKATAFAGKVWKQIAGGMHHAVALDENGTVYAFGRSHDGRLGLGDEAKKKQFFHEPTVVEGLRSKKCVRVAAGGSTSYAITSEGELYSWGFGENFQLASGNEEFKETPFLCKGHKDHIEGKVALVNAGGQHVAVTICGTVAVPK